MWPASQSGIYEDPGVKKERAEGETDRVEAKAVVAKHPASRAGVKKISPMLCYVRYSRPMAR